MKSNSNKMLVLNLILILFTYLAGYFWIQLGLTDNENIYLGFIGVIIFGLSVSGFFVGMTERTQKGKITLIGIFGNLILTILFFMLFGSVISDKT
jgi:hypothetical protein